MKILYDHQIFSIQKYGGISRYFYQLMDEFEKTHDVSFTVAVRCTENHYLFNLESLKGLKRCTDDTPALVHMFSRFLAGRDNYSRNREYSQQVIMKEDFDLFHPTYYNPYFLKNTFSRPFVLTVHDMIHELYPEYFPLSDRTVSMKKNLIDAADEIICVSKNTKNDLLNLYSDVDDSKVHVIYHANSLVPCRSGSSIEGSHDAPGSRERLLFVGPRDSYKNFYFFIVSSVKLLKKYPWLDIVCAGGGTFTLDERDFFRRLGMQDRIYHYRVDDKQLATLYATSLALIFPSQYEGFGLPILESFACRCPVICSNSSSLPEIAKDAAVYFPPKDSISMQTAIESVISDQDIRKEMIKKGLHYVNNFSWEQSARQTKNVYGRALGQ
jgi:glycosyltransferase involved in cell wall biosynthesis